ncbi:neuropeptide SIFamide receptor-like [Lingula anatina]|uniref:Neuropeptide SIFamide receptor-like n=1 Tax=Lingula anatina TaxID=7574 RepID=A0A1S3KGI8_LINAN|nr:neuropeptide SIFamide receptor-like [Lingula anatina]|eukprot:XP_013421569.1 neuropeptide SIFamide receptor-like [Lingula anatina]
MPTLVTHIYSGWVMGWLMCKLLPFITCVAVVSSISTLTAIAIDRYLAICTTFNCSSYKITKSSAKVIIGIIWLYAFLVPIPWAVVYKHELHPEQSIWVCYDGWLPNQRKVYFMVAILFLNYIVPLFIISVCYTMITVIVVNRRPPSPTANTSNVIYRSKIKVVKMLSVVVVVFALSWLPLYSLKIIIDFELLVEESASWLVIVKYLFPFAQWLTYFNACMNPFIYSFLSNKYRHAFREMIKCLYCNRRHLSMRDRVGTYSLGGTNSSTSTSGLRVRGKEERGIGNGLGNTENLIKMQNIKIRGKQCKELNGNRSKVDVPTTNRTNFITLTEHVTTV